MTNQSQDVEQLLRYLNPVKDLGEVSLPKLLDIAPNQAAPNQAAANVRNGHWHRLTRRRPRTLRLAALGVGIALLAIPLAYAFDAADVVSFIHNQPASPTVTNSFEILRIDAIAANSARAAAGIDAAYPEAASQEAHGLLGIKTANGPAYVWVAPANGDRQCWLIQLPGEATMGDSSDGRIGCDALPMSDGKPLQDVAVVQSADGTLTVCHGLTSPQAKSVEVELNNGTSMRTNVIGQHFLVPVAPGVQPTSVAAFDGQGQELGEAQIQ